MSQQAKDIYAGIKKIFPSSRRSGNFSLASRVSAASLDTALAAEAQARAREKAATTKEGRPSSFSFSGWKEKHRASCSAPPPPIVMSLPYGATAATPKAPKSLDDSDKGPRLSLTQTLHNALHLRRHGPSTTKVKATTSAFSSTSAQPPQLGSRSLSAGEDQRATSYQQKRGLASFSAVKTVSSSYQSSSSALSSLTGRTESSIAHPSRQKQDQRMALAVTSLKQQNNETEEREWTKRGSLDTKEQTGVRPHASTWDSDSEDDYEDTKRPTPGLGRRSNSMDFMEQAPTHLISKLWRKLPIQARLIGGRGNVDLDLEKDRTSFSRSSEARKFARAADKAKAAELQRRSLSEPKESVPDQVDDVLALGVAKRTRFSSKLALLPSDANDGAAGAYTALESYDDVLVRVCRFAAHDQRPTTTKVQEFLERSMAFLHATRTKHGNVVNISNGEIRMWRRLALHDWTLEEVTTAQAAAALGVKGKDVQAPMSRHSFVMTETTDSDSDSQQLRGRRRLHSAALHRSLSESVVEEEPEIEGDEDEKLEVPSHMKFAKLCDVINYCVNFGEVLFTPDEIKDLVRLEFIVEEDGWI